MSAIEQTSDVAVARVGRLNVYGGSKVIVHHVTIRGIHIGNLNHYQDIKHPDPKWQVALFGSEIFGHGMTPAEAVRNAFVVIDRAKAISVKYGAEIMR